MGIYILFKIVFIYTKQIIMDGEGGYDPTDDMGAAGGATGGGDENPQGYNVPGGPTDSPYERRRWWQKEGARTKDTWAYQKLPQDDKGIPMSEFPKEKNGLPKQKGTAENSFRNEAGELNYTAARTFLENEVPDENMVTREVKQDFRYLDKDQLDLHYKEIKRQGTKVRAIIEIKMKHKDKWYPLYTRKRGDTEKK